MHDPIAHDKRLNDFYLNRKNGVFNLNVNKQEIDI